MVLRLRPMSVARLILPCGLWMINSWKRVVSSLIIPWVVAIWFVARSSPRSGSGLTGLRSGRWIRRAVVVRDSLGAWERVTLGNAGLVSSPKPRPIRPGPDGGRKAAAPGPGRRPPSRRRFEVSPRRKGPVSSVRGLGVDFVACGRNQIQRGLHLFRTDGVDAGLGGGNPGGAGQK